MLAETMADNEYGTGSGSADAVPRTSGMAAAIAAVTTMIRRITAYFLRVVIFGSVISR